MVILVQYWHTFEDLYVKLFRIMSISLFSVHTTWIFIALFLCIMYITILSVIFVQPEVPSALFEDVYTKPQANSLQSKL